MCGAGNCLRIPLECFNVGVTILIYFDNTALPRKRIANHLFTNATLLLIL